MLVETFAIPVLMKAVDFLFDEAKNILAERQATRQEAGRQATAPPDIPLLDQDKESILRRKVSEELARQQEQAIQSLLEEIEIYRRNYQRLKKRVALEGGLDFAPVSVANQLQAQEDAILETSQRLAAIVNALTEQTDS